MLSHSFIFICANPPLHTVPVYHTRVMLNSDYHIPVSVHSEIRSAFNKDDVPTFVSACTHFQLYTRQGLRETNSHIDLQTSLHSMVLLCQPSPHITDFQHHVLNGTEQEQLALLCRLFLRFACGQLLFCMPEQLFINLYMQACSTVHYMQLKFREVWQPDTQWYSG